MNLFRSRILPKPIEMASFNIYLACLTINPYEGKIILFLG